MTAVSPVQLSDLVKEEVSLPQFEYFPRQQGHAFADDDSREFKPSRVCAIRPSDFSAACDRYVNNRFEIEGSTAPPS